MDSSGVKLATELEGQTVSFYIKSCGLAQVGKGVLEKISTSKGTFFKIEASLFSLSVDTDQVRSCTYESGTFSFFLPGNVLVQVSIVWQEHE